MGANTALVTGASAGIGRVFAEQLAARGDDVVLVARDKARLEELASELERVRGVHAEVLAADLTNDSDLLAVEERLRDPDRPVDLLVNNAGFGTFGRFHELPVEQEQREVQLNVVALVRLTHAALGPMVARGHGGVINVASVAAFQPIPRNATYAATKAYVLHFTEAIHDELEGTGVTAMACCPGYTHTEFATRAGVEDAAGSVPGFMWDEADVVVRDALAGLARGRATSVPTWKNKALAGLSGTLSHKITRRLSGAMMRRGERLRAP
ncbi:MAG: SDR family oxidoreductase [Acidimicrobiia bacterium]